MKHREKSETNVADKLEAGQEGARGGSTLCTGTRGSMIRGAAQKVIFLVARPLRPYPPPPQAFFLERSPEEKGPGNKEKKTLFLKPKKNVATKLEEVGVRP